jgi:hypothetical protein
MMPQVKLLEKPCGSGVGYQVRWHKNEARRFRGRRKQEPPRMARLVAVNVGMPRDIAWRGKTVHTGIHKSPVAGRVMVRRLNIDGDGQGDLGGHGGLNRPVMVYQLDSYRYWERELNRSNLSYGQLERTSPWTLWPTRKCVSAIAIALAALYSRFRNRELLVIAWVSAWMNRRWRRSW